METRERTDSEIRRLQKGSFGRTKKESWRRIRFHNKVLEIII